MEIRKRNTSRLAPWNWFKHEEPEQSAPNAVQPSTHPMARLHHEMDRLFDDEFRSFGFPERSDGGWPTALEPTFLKPSVDIRALDDRYEVTVEVPGIDEKDLNLTVQNDALVISGEKQSEVKDDNADQWHRVERSYGQFQRVLALPADADEDGIRARFTNGVLTVDLPRTGAPSENRRRIDIEH